MRVHYQRSLVLILLLNLFVSLPLAMAQPNADVSLQAQRQKAVALFNQGKRLEALPLLEELAQKSPRDAELLVELAASLIDHAATLTDQQAAAKERFRARDLIEKAWGLGNTSTLAENLRQLLEELPANGALKFSDNPAVVQVMNAGEAAFSRRDFDEALKNYAKALELEPKNYFAVLFTANTYDRTNDFAKAGEWYERAMRMDPDVETAYRYYADMLAKQGEMAEARTMLMHAAVAEPYNKIVWREIRAWSTINNALFNPVFLAIPLPRSDNTAVGSGSKLSPELASAWRTYYSVKSEWKKGGKFEKQFPQEGEYRHSLAEESEALTKTAKVLEALREKKETAQLIASDPSAALLLKLHETGLTDAYVLFSLGDDGIAKDYVAYRAKNRDKLETYIDKFVIAPAPAK
ncbi:MAG TPA: tetratricopeptide repeat protein [Terriglobales bacterium]